MSYQKPEIRSLGTLAPGPDESRSPDALERLLKASGRDETLSRMTDKNIADLLLVIWSFFDMTSFRAGVLETAIARLRRAKGGAFEPNASDELRDLSPLAEIAAKPDCCARAESVDGDCPDAANDRGAHGP